MRFEQETTRARVRARVSVRARARKNDKKTQQERFEVVGTPEGIATRTATHCNKHTATYSNTLQHTAKHTTTCHDERIQQTRFECGPKARCRDIATDTATHCNKHIATTHCNTLQHTTTRESNKRDLSVSQGRGVLPESTSTSSHSTAHALRRRNTSVMRLCVCVT